MILTSELIADLRVEATQATGVHRAAQIAGPIVLALLDRIEALEKDKADALEDLRSAKATLERVNAGLRRLREMDGG